MRLLVGDLVRYEAYGALLGAACTGATLGVANGEPVGCDVGAPEGDCVGREKTGATVGKREGDSEGVYVCPVNVGVAVG